MQTDRFMAGGNTEPAVVLAITGCFGRRQPAGSSPTRARQLIPSRLQPAQIASRSLTPSLAISAPRPRITISPRSITRYWSASSAAKS